MFVSCLVFLPHKLVQIQNSSKGNQVQQVDGIKAIKSKSIAAFSQLRMEAQRATIGGEKGRCQSDQWEQTANESKLHRGDSRPCHMSTDRHQMLTIFCCQKRKFIFFFPHSFFLRTQPTSKMLNVINLCFSAHAHLTVPSNYGQKKRRGGGDALYDGWRSFLYSPPSLFSTDAIIHNASGRLVRVKYRAQPACALPPPLSAQLVVRLNYGQGNVLCMCVFLSFKRTERTTLDKAILKASIMSCLMCCL